MRNDLIDVPVRLAAQTAENITRLAEQCGLTGDQMASAMFVLAMQNYVIPQPAISKKPRSKK